MPHDIKYQRATLDEWTAWLNEELADDGKDSHILSNPDPEQRKQMYQHVVRGFLDVIVALKETR
jgi:hypothetical protein